VSDLLAVSALVCDTLLDGEWAFGRACRTATPRQSKVQTYATVTRNIGTVSSCLPFSGQALNGIWCVLRYERQLGQAERDLRLACRRDVRISRPAAMRRDGRFVL